MTPGPIEEGGETVRTLISSMKESPITLALVLFNLCLLVLLYFNGVSARASTERLYMTMMEQEKRTAEMLYNCAPIKRQSEDDARIPSAN